MGKDLSENETFRQGTKNHNLMTLIVAESLEFNLSCGLLCFSAI